MKRLPLIVFCFVLSYGSLSAQNLSDSGFTNRNEAKNLMVNGLKEGKWIEFPYLVLSQGNSHYDNRYLPPRRPDRWIVDSSSYRLTIYHTGVPIGTVRGYYAGGILRECSHYSNGLKNGIEKDYNVIGIFWHERDYIDGKVKAVREYFTNGALAGESYFNDSGIYGMSRRYYQNGKIQTETPYTDGKRNGVEKVYYQSGKLWGEYPYTNDKSNGVIKDYYESGMLQREVIYNNGKVGISKYYDENGNEK